MLLTSKTALLHSNNEEASQDLSFKVSEKAENATQIDGIIVAAEALKDDNSLSTQIDNVIGASEIPKDDNSVSISIRLKEEIEGCDWSEVGDDHNVSILTELLTIH